MGTRYTTCHRVLRVPHQNLGHSQTNSPAFINIYHPLGFCLDIFQGSSPSAPWQKYMYLRRETFWFTEYILESKHEHRYKGCDNQSDITLERVSQSECTILVI